MVTKQLLYLFCFLFINVQQALLTELVRTPSDLLDRVKFSLQLEKTQKYQTCTRNLSSWECPSNKYRTATGECNNVVHKTWGARGDIFLRLLNANYADGASTPHLSTSLPDADTATNNLRAQIDSSQDHPYITAMLPAWGYAIIYDILQITVPSLETNCCNIEGSPLSFLNETTQCFIYKGENCKEYVRTATSYDIENCGSNQRQQMNAASSYIDGSGLYGTTDNEFKRLRTLKNGQINEDECYRCKGTGVVALLHKILLSEHNRIAGELFEENPMWDDTKLYLESRRIVVAEMQHITFTEFLPTFLGQKFATRQGLVLYPEKHADFYSSSNRPGIYNEFAVIAADLFSTIMSTDMINKPFLGEPLLALSSKLRSGSLQTLVNKWDSIAFAVQRGRDHGIPSYKKMSEFCRKQLSANNLNIAIEESFNLKQEHINMLEAIYHDIENVDLVVGALLEEPKLDSIFGDTISCLFAMQFENLRKTDRFWYENELPPSSFRKDQLKSIRKVTLAGLLCANGVVSESQPKVFIKDDQFLNSRLPCNQLPGIDLTPWKIVMIQNTTKPNESVEKSHTPFKLNDNVLHSAYDRAKKNYLERKQFEYESWLAQGGIDAKSPDGTAASFSKANRNALLIANNSLLFELTSNEIVSRAINSKRKKRQVFDNNLNAFSREDLAATLQTIDISSFISGTLSPVNLEQQCEDFNTPCDPTQPFRPLSGHCNNLRNPTLGQSLTTFSRLLPPQYEDGISRPRISTITGTRLPNPRVISTLIHPDISNLHTRYTLMVMQYAQFLDHDLTMTPIHKGFHESIPSCRSCDSPRTVHPECNPFPVPAADHYYPEVNITSGERLCFPFMRSLPGQQNLGPREQINQNTAYLDASQIYGENNCVATMLRGFSGRLNSTTHPIKGKELLPQSPTHPECKSPSGLCFIAGDGRASEQPGLTAIHTTFLREHNRIVEGLRGVNPHWNGDQLFEHARKIVVAQNQHITYNEFLPRILSWNAVNLYGIKLLSQGYYKEYDASCNPSVFNEFAAAAFRIGHSLLRPHIPRLSPNHHPIDPPLLLRDGFFKMDALLQPGIIDEINRGMVSTPMETLDQFITGEVTNHLFEDRRIPFSGIDLISLNIQRGRDHGIQSYNNYRALCNLKRARNWEDLSREIPVEVITRFKKIYPTVDDIDLFPGAMTERPLQGGLVGPTLACIIGIQFRQLRKCDRYWYETDNADIKFTENQLAEIRKTTLAKITCENLEIPGDMQRAAFDLPSNFLNPRIPCHTMAQINLSEWRENTQGCQISRRHVKVGESAFPSPCTSCVCTIEGPQCASLRITDCSRLIQEWSRDAVLRDDVCNAQCGTFLQGEDGTAGRKLQGSPLLRNSRSRTSNSFDFKLPDLAPFVASL